MDFLKKLNISDEVIEKMKRKYSNIEISEITGNFENISRVIQYFREIGIDEYAIKSFLLHDVNALMIDFDDIYKTFEGNNKLEIVESINEDYVTIYHYI